MLHSKYYEITLATSTDAFTFLSLEKILALKNVKKQSLVNNLVCNTPEVELSKVLSFFI